MLEYKSMKSSPRESLPNTQAWGGTTDPTDHDPESFRYLVHMDSGLTYFKTAACIYRLLDTHPEKEGARYLDDLSQIRTANTLSASLIDQNNKKLWFAGRYGLILNILEQDIIATAPHDAYPYDAEYFGWIKSKYGVMKPEALIAKTTGHNEVVCTPSAVTVAGVLLLDETWPDRPDTPHLEDVISQATESNLPIVVLGR